MWEIHHFNSYFINEPCSTSVLVYPKVPHFDPLTDVGMGIMGISFYMAAETLANDIYRD